MAYHMIPKHDLTGKTFGLLTVLKREGRKTSRAATWLCWCKCGNLTIVESRLLNSGNTKSCGCARTQTLRAHPPRLRHGQGRKGKQTTEYKTWCGIKDRCENPNNPNYKHYGGRGIFVCERWQTFENFFADMGYKPHKRLTIERRDNDGPYSPKNCYWATQLQQARNKRGNTVVKIGGQSLCLSELAERLLIPYHRFHYLYRIKELSVEEIKRLFPTL